jgi:hypothetical protein
MRADLRRAGGSISARFAQYEEAVEDPCTEEHVPLLPERSDELLIVRLLRFSEQSRLCIETVSFLVKSKGEDLMR